MKTEKTIVFENNYVKYVIAGNGGNINFIDKATATDYCPAHPVGSFICLKKNGTSYTPSRCTFVNSEIHAEFDETGVSAVVRVTQKERYFVFELTSISDNDIDEFVILNIHLNMPGYDQAMILNMIRNDKFAVCLLALNLKVNVTSVPDTSVQIITKEPFRSGKPVLSAVSYPE
ncbi:hypothetical protein KAW55_00695, partial [bacterium]|nr:hypothetical protein [bacterium]